MIAAVRNPEVGELAERRVADAGRGQPVGELARRRVGLERLVDQRVASPRPAPAARSRPRRRSPGGRSGSRPRRRRAARRCSAWPTAWAGWRCSAGACRPAPSPVKLVKPRDDPGGDAGEQDGLQVGPRLARRDQRGQVGEHARVQDGQQGRQAGLGDVAARTACRPTAAASSTGPCGPSGISTSLTSGLPSRDTCRNGPLSTFWPLSASHSRTRWRLAVVHTPMVGMAAPGQRGDRHLDRDRVHVQVVGGVDPGPRLEAGQAERGVQVRERPQVGQVEDRAQVDVEGLGPLPGEHRDPAAQLVHRLGGQRAVVRRGQRPDVARRAGQPGADGPAAEAGRTW